jgi:hypothetical protein
MGIVWGRAPRPSKPSASSAATAYVEASFDAKATGRRENVKLPSEGIALRSAWLLFTLTVVTTLSMSQATHYPVVTSGETPLYPLLAGQARIQGEVQLRVTTDGSRPVSVSVESGQPMLAKAAEDNVKTWTFLKHEPTSFESHFSYTLNESCDPGMPENGRVLLELPIRVAVTAPRWPFKCDPNWGLDLSEPLRVFLTECELNGSNVPCDRVRVTLGLGSSAVIPERFRVSSDKQGFVVPKEFRSAKNFNVTFNINGSEFTSANDSGFLKGNWRIGIDHRPFKEQTPVYNVPEKISCVGFIEFEWGEPEVAVMAPCKEAK